jgi:UDP-N-acetylmuramoylalanine--D-glutamate ligase
MEKQNIKKVTIIGAAESGAAAALLLTRRGFAVFVTEMKTREEIMKNEETANDLRLLEQEHIPVELGGHSERVFDCDLMVVSPGVPLNVPTILEAQRRGIRMTSELEIASRFCQSTIVGITGTNGKTTTTTLTGKILQDAGRKSVVAGNIQPAFSSVVDSTNEKTIVVLEVSSFQLDTTEEFRPKIGVLLNITPDHLERYNNSMDEYAASKSRIFQHQKNDDWLIYNADDRWTRRIVTPAQSRKLAFGTKRSFDEGAYVENGYLNIVLGGVVSEIIAVHEVLIPGPHNLQNAMAAALAAMALGVEPKSIRTTLKSFGGVEHRLEFVRDVKRVRYINDSKATNIDSVWYALQSFDRPLILMLGGYDKVNDYARLHDLVRQHVREIVALGETADKVVDSFMNIVPVYKTTSFEESVMKASALAVPGDIVLFSPACKSFDWFKNYRERGQLFKKLVHELPE